MGGRTIALIILDGFGISNEKKGNAIFSAKTPNFDKYLKENPNSVLEASGLSVGLPEGQMGNSEVGHTNIGAGRIVYQELIRITKSILDGDFFKNEVLLKAIKNCKENNSALHLLGLVSDGGVHSHIEHLFGLIDLAKKNDLKKVFIHVITDGRDVSPTSGINFIKKLKNGLDEKKIGKIATVSGRYYAMDRDNNFDRIKKAYDAISNGIGNFVEEKDLIKKIKESYCTKDKNGAYLTDEFIIPIVIKSDNKIIGSIKENDSIICFNFRPDRAREITRSFVDEKFSGFDRQYKKVFYVCMTQYDENMPNVLVAFKPQILKNTFGEYISKKGLTQLRIAETEKYAHVTFFFNGGVEKVYSLEDRKLILSPKVATYDLKPEMSAYLVADECEKLINSDKYDVIILNFANPDMVGHTGVFDAAVKAVEAVDECLGKVVNALEKKGAIILITADHGNAEKMIDIETNKIFTAHTINFVPFIVLGENEIKLENGRLCDIAPTMLDLMKLNKPEEMLGKSLIKK